MHKPSYFLASKEADTGIEISDTSSSEASRASKVFDSGKDMEEVNYKSGKDTTEMEEIKIESERDEDTVVEEFTF